MPELPISEKSARLATRWLMSNFGPRVAAAGAGTPFTPAILCGIVCQETAYFWLPLLKKLSEDPAYKDDPRALADEVLARCVLDASGDAPDSSRSAFPKNTAAFRKEYDTAFADRLIAEANRTRALRGYGPKEWVYKGYGIFQYDLQFVVKDEAFFRQRLWYSFDECCSRVMSELRSKLKATGELWEAVRAYNGSGPRARAYRDNVKVFAGWAAEEIAASPALAQPAAAMAKPKAKPVPVGAAAGIMAAKRPAMTREELLALIAPHGLDRVKHPLIVVGIRGYYRNTMGAPNVNDRGIYDDAIFLDSADGFVSFNGNTDPSRYRPGYGTAESTKGIASLNPGAWFVHRFDLHKGEYLALCQRLGKVTVTRDGINGPYPDTGSFGINIHRGSYNGTSSLGCQTLHPDQWGGFISLAENLARRYHGEKWKSTVIPYVLLDPSASAPGPVMAGGPVGAAAASVAAPAAAAPPDAGIIAAQFIWNSHAGKKVRKSVGEPSSAGFMTRVFKLRMDQTILLGFGELSEAKRASKVTAAARSLADICLNGFKLPAASSPKDAVAEIEGVLGAAEQTVADLAAQLRMSFVFPA